MGFAGLVEILSVETDDDYAHDKLEEAHEDARGTTDGHIRGHGGAGGGLLTLHGATVEEVQHGDEELDHVNMCGDTVMLGGDVRTL